MKSIYSLGGRFREALGCCFNSYGIFNSLVMFFNRYEISNTGGKVSLLENFWVSELAAVTQRGPTGECRMTEGPHIQHQKKKNQINIL